jgi:hypothetical protein
MKASSALSGVKAIVKVNYTEVALRATVTRSLDPRSPCTPALGMIENPGTTSPATAD